MATLPVQNLRPGDLLLHAGKSEISKLIKWASDSPYSHIAMVFAPGIGAEAVSGGVGYKIDLNERVAHTGVMFIDAVRPLQSPLTPALLAALQDSARRMKDAEFAVNQMFELGVISAIRNKVPANFLVKLLLEWVWTVLVPADPARLVCSEFIYLAYRLAETTPPGQLIPRIVEKNRPDMPFPDVDWGKLLDEYRDASDKATESLAAALTPAAALAGAAPDAADAELDARYERARQQVLGRLREARPSAPAAFLSAAESAASGTHPELLLPQHFADSPSFVPLGRVVP